MHKKDNLSPRHLIFAKEYLVDRNSTRAAIAAGYSEKSAHSQGCRLLKHAKIRAFIDDATKDMIESLDISAKSVIEEVANSAFFDIRNIFDGSSLKNITDLDDKTARAITSVKCRIEKLDGENFAEVIEVKTNCKLKSLDMLAKHLGLYESDNSQKDSNITIVAKEPDF